MTAEARRIELIMELRGDGISDTRVLSALERVPREAFIPAHLIEHAYDNRALPIGHGQTISQPYVVAYMTQKLEVGERMKVLEIGTGSGYQAAVLAPLCRRLYTVERDRALLREAERRFAQLRINNIVTRHGDGMAGWPGQAPFDRIIVTAAATSVPDALVEQLADGGIMVIPVGADRFEQEILHVRRKAGGHEIERLLPVRFVPLIPGTASEMEDVT
jgi:protein-L-isoaspartate(D-aspartate) O-methyltransferase